MVRAIKENLPTVLTEEHPETIASAIRIGAPVNAEKALVAIRMTGGTAESVTDEEILAMQRDLARKEGIGVSGICRFRCRHPQTFAKWVRSIAMRRSCV